MAYGSTAGVKDWLRIPTSDTAADSEIDTIRSIVSNFMDEYLRLYTTVPISSPPSIIDDICNMWSAGIYAARGRDDGRHAWVDQAREMFMQYLAGRYGAKEHKKRILTGTKGVKYGDD